MSQQDDNLVSCSDGCKRSLHEDEVLPAGWSYLAISKRWRCPECHRALAAINQANKGEPA